ncbi:ROK family transcriptional regulator [Dankookia rubra]|uniref:ROK family transcriptional regulator n=1 Tax=Dankookia rubra TaxID=1442381 RepID=A0A4R5QBV4_9PROT|nr:ROK family transcriptional regulator [Dankookia rubra]TDH60580.1 ROK family transcriptional regulator [Dankookia rubra]
MTQGGDLIPDEPGAPAASTLSRGTSQAGVRLYNERLVLSLLRRHGSLSKIEIARLTGLSPQTTTTIVNRLEQERFVLPGEPRRGRIGQPAVPFRLNADGAFALGLVIGRRSADVVLMDFVAGLRARQRSTYAVPDAGRVLGFARDTLGAILDGMTPAERARLAGLGVAIPFDLWSWEEELGIPAGALEAWRHLDVAEVLAAQVAPLPVHVFNDATAACAAELSFGRQSRGRRDFLYVYLGAFIGGGLVLDGQLFPGRTGNAGAIGSMPVAAPGGGAPRQLLHTASLYALERHLLAAGHDASAIWLSPDEWRGFGEPLDAWLDEAATGLAQAVVAANAVVDFEAVVIEGAFPREVRSRLVARVAQQMEALDRQGLSGFEVVEGSIGRDARAIGAASLPLLASFARDREVLFKASPTRPEVLRAS